jgi:hypothetical protein
MEIVYILQNGKKLDKNAFLSYLSGKIKKTANKFGVKKPSNKVYCLDDAAIDIVYGLMAGKKAKIRKSEFLYCLKNELEIYAKLRGKKFKFVEYKGLKKKIKTMLGELEKQHKEIKYAILNSESQLNPLKI